jgi:hypothetical protein
MLLIYRYCIQFNGFDRKVGTPVSGKELKADVL